MHKGYAVILGLALLAAAVLVVSTGFGPAGIPFLGMPGGDTASLILFDIRLPRVIAAMLVGAGLAAAGVVMQAMFRNSMADPYLLGTSSGGALGASLAIVLLGGAFHSVFAFAGCLIASFLVYGIAQKGGRVKTEQLLLTGIAISMFFSAILSAVMYSSGQNLHQILFWLMGGFWNISWSDALLGLAVIPVSLVLLLYSRELNIFSMGEDDAIHLGVNVNRLKIILLALSSLVTGICVAIAGCIGFVGLITPHIVRIAVGPDHRFLLPASMLAGGILLVLADTVARTVGNEVPVGVVTAFIGAPFFIWLLRKRYSA
ncbi:transport system permease protein [Methanoregula boonei 6A8]|jgi:iron complex transport system permease protein|uniref:Cobalamin import system permease protein BtuC n=1 Tax=Methanoregula boonei (strain DSM 21154 / JCM 14090 / 6A8) TaxID=456442 RepID=A7I6Z3_METB6|nr:iron chelate uptake ABC transporter family permease subunit [Methanoregula boonei]ABS55504.1 transport system permease protein [Methanoregula boonei 6A8]